MRISDEEFSDSMDVLAAAISPEVKKLLILPPDFTRFHSRAGEITSALVQRLKHRMKIDILPALGTHVAMSAEEISRMFKGCDPGLFHVHDWRHGIRHLGVIEGEFIRECSGGRLDYPIRIDLDTLICEGNHDLILSVGQVVPHEVVGMANHNKNIFVGAGGKDIIDKSHFLGAVCNMEKIMGRVDTPVRRVFDEAEKRFMAGRKILYVQTVVSPDQPKGLALRGLYAGYGREAFNKAAALAQQTNFILMDRPFSKVVVWLDPEEFKSTWLGGKAVYRTRMAMADQGELVILAPGLREFGEDPQIDRLIRKHGYRGTAATLGALSVDPDLKANFSAAAHLIHGSSEGRFSITYCPGPACSREEIESVGLQSGDLAAMLKRYPPEQLKDGFQQVDGEEIFFIRNPALGLWALKEHFANDQEIA